MPNAAANTSRWFDARPVAELPGLVRGDLVTWPGRFHRSVANWPSDIQLLVVVGAHAVALLAEYAEARQAHLLQPVLHRCEQHPEPVLHAAAKIDRGRLRKVLGRAGDFADAKTEVGGLREH